MNCHWNCRYRSDLARQAAMVMGITAAPFRKQFASNSPLVLSPPKSPGAMMTATQIALFNRLKSLGFRPGNQMKLYGETFEFLSKPIVMTDNVVLLDAIEKKTGQTRRVRIPLPIMNMATGARTAA